MSALCQKQTFCAAAETGTIRSPHRRERVAIAAVFRRCPRHVRLRGKRTCQNFSCEPQRHPTTHPTVSAVFYCDNHFNFDGCVARQFSHANRRTRVSTALTEQIVKKIRGGVDHLRLLVESRSRSNEASYL